MQLPCRTRADAALLSVFLLPYFAAATGGLDCEHLRVDGIPFDLRALGGPRSVVNSIKNPASTRNTTYTIDICQPLKKAKNIKPELQCPNSSRICSITNLITNDSSIVEEVFPIAGELQGNGGGNLNAKWSRLKNSPSHSDSEEEGLLIEMNGGFKPENGKKTPQKAIIKFVCDESRTGLENLPSPEDKYLEKAKRDEGESEGEGEDEDTTPSLRFVRYQDEDNVGVLRLTWLTEHACENSKEEKDKERSQHWGFFTWFIIIAFLSTAAYLIFGSWLNYNRHGARGWDLLPHSDTIRDVPYLLKDWIRRVLNTVQGGGSRGGYAAV